MAKLDERDKKGRVRRVREGVYRSGERNLDLLFVTLEKSASDYTPTTMYNDYPLSSTRFHWESQNSAHEASAVGQRYIGHEEAGGTILLFVRRTNKDARGETTPYTLLGPVRYVSHEGGRPMRIIWELEHAMPPALYQDIRMAAG